MEGAIVQLRREKMREQRAVEALTREAFWNRFVPGCSEHYLLYLMREVPAFIPELDLVAECEGRLVGSIVYMRAALEMDSGERREVISFGPVAVLPAFQGRGVGKRLIRGSLFTARQLGYRAVLIYGDPDYYGRFGFAAAETYGIATADNCYADALLALELVPGALAGGGGRFVEDDVFNVNPEAAAAFDQLFPFKERRSGLPSQQRFLEISSRRRPRR